MSGLDFAKRQLQKHGWTEGAGLGKHETGRSAPVKVSLKMDKRGVGHDPGKEFTDHWWLRVFNETAQKIGQPKDDSSPDAEAKARQKKMAADKKNFYKGFVKSSTLTNGVEEKDDSSSEDEAEDKPTTSVPSLEDIHKFCGGATGHKAARFGIKMKGKLSRVASYDKLFEEKQKTSSQPSLQVTSTFGQDLSSDHHIETQGSQSSHSESVTEESKKKKKKKRKKKKDEEKNIQRLCISEKCDDVSSSKNIVVNQEDNHSMEEPVSDSKGQRKKKKKRKDKTEEDNGLSVIRESAVDSAQATNDGSECKKEKKRNKLKESVADSSEEQNNITDKKKKGKRKSENENVEELTRSKRKKKKRKDE